MDSVLPVFICRRLHRINKATSSTHCEAVVESSDLLSPTQVIHLNVVGVQARLQAVSHDERRQIGDVQDEQYCAQN
jgi:hypothetical protein